MVRTRSRTCGWLRRLCQCPRYAYPAASSPEYAPCNWRINLVRASAGTRRLYAEASCIIRAVVEHNTAFIFPGQGSQYAGMGKDVAEKYPAARRVFDDIDRALGFSISKV